MIPKPEPILDLEGITLEHGWTIGQLLRDGAIGSGGYFSVCYLAKKNDGQHGFLKAFDFRKALREPDVAQAMYDLSSAYLFERNLLDYTNQKRIKKIVTALLYGQIDKPEAPNNSINYIIFELAEGDSREQLTKSNKRDFVWCYRVLHNICVALAGLHRNNIYHQDIKPSNILVFDGGMENKVADFGRSHCDKFEAPHQNLAFAGYTPYAPPESLYYYKMLDTAHAKKAGDLYELASMIHFFFTGTALTPVLISKMRDQHKPRIEKGWTGKYVDIVPYLQLAFQEVTTELEQHLEREIPKNLHAKFIPDTIELFILLGNVEPERRGKNSSTLRPQYDLQWFLSKFDLLSKKAELLNRTNAKAA